MGGKGETEKEIHRKKSRNLRCEVEGVGLPCRIFYVYLASFRHRISPILFFSTSYHRLSSSIFVIGIANHLERVSECKDKWYWRNDCPALIGCQQTVECSSYEFSYANLISSFQFSFPRFFFLYLRFLHNFLFHLNWAPISNLTLIRECPE